MYKVRWFSVEPSGTYVHTSDTMSNRDMAMQIARSYMDMGMRAVVFARSRGLWRTEFDSAIGY